MAVTGSASVDAPTKGLEVRGSATDTQDRVALVLTGGGARAAYQVGLLRCLAKHYPDFRFDIVTGVSAGGINSCFLAGHRGTLAEAADALTDLWLGLLPERIFRVDPWSLLSRVLGWSMRLASGGAKISPHPRAMVDTTPLRQLLHAALSVAQDGTMPHIAENIAEGRLAAAALSTLDWSTGTTVTWVEGQQGEWTRPGREGRSCRLTLDHVMASASLPLLFPAVKIEDSWHGDGGVRLAFPLAPAIHLGARRIVAISTRHLPHGRRTRDIDGYPPPAQVAGILMNAVFLDQLDADAMRLERINRLLPGSSPEAAADLRPVEIHIVRPSRDLGRLAGEFESRLPATFRFLTRGLGTRETKSPDLLSLLMFQPDYAQALIEIGQGDAQAQSDELRRLLRPEVERQTQAR